MAFTQWWLLITGSTYFCYVIGMVYFALVHLGILFTLWNITLYIIFLHWNMKLVNIRIKQYTERFYGLTTYRPQVWLPITMGETQTFFWAGRGSGIPIFHLCKLILCQAQADKTLKQSPLEVQATSGQGLSTLYWQLLYDWFKRRKQMLTLMWNTLK